MTKRVRDLGPWVTTKLNRLPSRQIRCCQLTVKSGADSGKTVQVDKPRFLVGGLASNDLQLTDSAVSGHHFELLLEPEGYRIRDLNSRNGTRLGNALIHDATLLDGASITVGDSCIGFSLGEESVAVPASESVQFGPLIGCSMVMRELFAQLERVAPTTATVLITGETGTGKEAVAAATVGASDRADGPMVVVDCGALAPSLVEAELFGHEKGAFTGASEAAAGAFERAHGGTVFLDEIGELPLELQPKLLRVLEAHQVRRLGAKAPKTVDIRVVAATHRALEQQVNSGNFRADLFYRLSVFSVTVPPLRRRREDIPLLAEHFLSQLPYGNSDVLTTEVLERLGAHDWPGNVRELRNAVERLALGTDPLGGPQLAQTTDPAAGATSQAIDLSTPFRLQKDQLVRNFELRYARALLEYSPNNLAKAARKAGLDRMAVVKLLHRHGLLPE